MQLILGDDRLHGWDLGHLMPLGLGIFPLQGVLTAGAALRLDGDDHVHLLHRHQRPGVPLMAGLPTWATPTGLRRGRFPRAWGGSLDGGRDEVREVLLHLLGQVLDRRFQALDDGLQRRHTGFEGTDVVLGLDGLMLPDLWWNGGLGIHGRTMVQEIGVRKQAFLVSPT